MNILFLLTPKAQCAYVRKDDTIRQALERMDASGFSALPILARDGTYQGTLTEGDLLWFVKNRYFLDLREAESHSIMEIPRRKDNNVAIVTTPVEDLLLMAVEQNFVPVVDDRNTFIGIVTRKAIMQQCLSILDSAKGGKKTDTTPAHTADRVRRAASSVR